MRMDAPAPSGGTWLAGWGAFGTTYWAVFGIIVDGSQRIALSADDSMVFTADQDEPRIAVIDTATNKLKAWVSLPGIAYGTKATSDGRWLIVLDNGCPACNCDPTGK